MPQLDSATWLSQIVWLAITFVVLLILMWGVALPKVRRTLEDRQTKIDGDLREAERLRDEANAALNAYEKALEEARSKAHAIATEMSAKVAEEAELKRSKLEAELIAESEKAENRIASARQAALDSVRDVAAEVTKDITVKLTGLAADDKQISAALNKAAKGSADA